MVLNTRSKVHLYAHEILEDFLFHFSYFFFEFKSLYVQIADAYWDNRKYFEFFPHQFNGIGISFSFDLTIQQRTDRKRNTSPFKFWTNWWILGRRRTLQMHFSFPFPNPISKGKWKAELQILIIHTRKFIFSVKNRVSISEDIKTFPWMLGCWSSPNENSTENEM